MKEKIAEICKSIEKQKKIRIFFAVENGSRAWRIESKDSDYDVRFVFVRLLEEYIQINKPEEVINLFFDKKLNACGAEGAYIDISGFDILKFVKMLSSSNPATIEWLTSDIVYYGKQNKAFRNFALNSFNPISLYHHYKSMCRNNYLKYLKSGSDVTYKRYLYAFRGLINAKWVAHKKSIPPIDLNETLEKSKNIIPESIIKKLYEIIELKSKGREKDIAQNVAKIDQYIESFLKDDSEVPKEKYHATLNVLNKELRRIVLNKN